MNVLVVYKKSVYELYSASHDENVQRYMHKRTFHKESMRDSHDRQERTLETVVRTLEETGVKYDMVYRAELPKAKEQGTIGELLSGRDLVVCVGGDGTFLETSHYIASVPMLGVNSDTSTSTGFYCSADAFNFPGFFKDIEKLPRATARRLKIIRNKEEVPELVLNDVLFTHPDPGGGTRYELSANGGVKGEYKDSGLLVCTPSGYSGWMIKFGGTFLPLNSKSLQYHHRDLRFGEQPHLARRLDVYSLTREGIMEIDGSHLKYDFGLGTEVRIRSAPPLVIIGNLEEKRQRWQSYVEAQREATRDDK